MVPVKKPADQMAMLLHLLEAVPVDKGLIDSGPERGKQDVHCGFCQLRLRQAAPVRLLIIRVIGLCQLLYPIMSEVGVPGILRAVYQQYKAVPPLLDRKSVV